MQKGNERFIAYIKNVLYTPDKAELNPSEFGEEDRELAVWIKKLGDWTVEAGRFAEAVAEGRENETTEPDSQNVLAEDIRNIRDRFSRMTDQIGKVVVQNKRGQGEGQPFGLNFDDMVVELQKRTSALENERNLFIKFTESANERIIVLDEESGEMVYANKIAREFFEKTRSYIDSAFDINRASGCTYRNPYSNWLHTVSHPDEKEAKVEYYQVHSIYILWEGRGAVAHMFQNVTAAKRNENLATRDALTGAFNRAYGTEYIGRIFKEGKRFSLAFIDIDYLKYCNDTFGHAAGDGYIVQVVALLRRADKDGILCRTGGDEFLMISETLDAKELEKRLEELRAELCGEYFADGRIHKNFSRGIVERGKDGDSPDELIGRADEKMYLAKMQNKKTNRIEIKDNRL